MRWRGGEAAEVRLLCGPAAPPLRLNARRGNPRVQNASIYVPRACGGGAENGLQMGSSIHTVSLWRKVRPREDWLPRAAMGGARPEQRPSTARISASAANKSHPEGWASELVGPLAPYPQPPAKRQAGIEAFFSRSPLNPHKHPMRQETEQGCRPRSGLAHPASLGASIREPCPWPAPSSAPVWQTSSRPTKIRSQEMVHGEKCQGCSGRPWR